MTEEIKANRDELAKRYVSLSAPEMARLQMSWDYKNGFDAGYALGLEASKGLLEALEFYGEFSNWYGEFKHRANKHFTDFSRSDLEQFDGHMVCGKRARQAIIEFKEKVGE